MEIMEQGLNRDIETAGTRCELNQTATVQREAPTVPARFTKAPSPWQRRSGF